MKTPTSSTSETAGSGAGIWFAIAAIGVLVAILLIGKFGGFFDPEDLGRSLGQMVREFADGPFGVPVLILTFVVCAYIAMPQFILIGVAIFAFGPVWGALYAWIATLVSGVITYWTGRISGQAVLSRVAGRRLGAFAEFVDRNAFVASAVVRNITAGPFVFVNMVFGALRAGFVPYMAGMAAGILPKILVIAFAGEGILAMLDGNPVWAAIMAAAIVAILVGGWYYARSRRRKGENIALDGGEAVDSVPPAQHE